MVTPIVDQNSDGGKALQRVLQEQLKDYLGQDYSDDVLPLYIVVMLAHGTTQALVAENLEAFLGDKEARKFADWLFKHLAENGATYAARQPVVEATPLTVGEPNGAREPAAERHEPQLERMKQPERRTREDDRRERAAEERGRKRERQREKIEWQGRRSGERADDARGPDKRRREELREERASGRLRQAYKRVQEEERRRADVRDSRDAYPDRTGSRDRERRRDRDRGRERARAVPEEEPGREQEREREREGGAVRERRDRSRGAASDAAREADRRERGRGGSPPARERMRRVALATEVLRIANGAAGPRADHQPVATHGASREMERQPGENARPSEPDAAPAARGSVFDRLGQASPEDEAPAASRKSVFDRIRGPPALAAAADVSGAVAPAAAAAGLNTGVGKFGLKEGADGVAELQMKLEALQAQIQRMDAEKALTAKANSGPSVDRCSVHVAGISPVAVPEVIAAHFSMCGRVVDVKIESSVVHGELYAFVKFAGEWEARNALALTGSVLLQQPITVTLKVNRPAYAPMGFGRGVGGPPTRGRGGYGRGGWVPGGRSPGPPYGILPGRGMAPGRARGRASHKWVRPEAAAAAAAPDTAAANP